MRVFLTGATGLLGSHLVESLVHEGHHVTALVGEIPVRSFLGQHLKKHNTQIELISGRLETFTSSQNYDLVIHNAAMVSALAGDEESIRKTNLGGTQSLFHKLKGRFGQWVQISSIATVCNGNREVVTEDNFGEARNTVYAQSKLAADLWLKENLENILIIHPCYMLGRWDSRPSSGAVMFAIRFGKVKSFANVTKNFVAARDVAQGVLLAIKGNQQGHFILGNQNIQLKDFFKALTQELGVENFLQEEALTEGSSEFVKEFCQTSAVDISKAKTKLGYNPQVNVSEMLKETMNYFEEFKMLKRAKKL